MIELNFRFFTFDGSCMEWTQSKMQTGAQATWEHLLSPTSDSVNITRSLTRYMRYGKYFTAKR